MHESVVQKKKLCYICKSISNDFTKPSICCTQSFEIITKQIARTVLEIRYEISSSIYSASSDHLYVQQTLSSIGKFTRPRTTRKSILTIDLKIEMNKLVH